MYALRSYDFHNIVCQNYEDRSKLLYVIEENQADIFRHIVLVKVLVTVSLYIERHRNVELTSCDSVEKWLGRLTCDQYVVGSIPSRPISG